MNEKFIAPGDGLAYRALGGETIIMSATDSTLFSLDEVGSLIWQGADGRTPLTEIVARICDHYDVTHEEARRDAEEFIAELAGRGLLVVSGQAILDTRTKVSGAL
jgi:hypothetical protein